MEHIALIIVIVLLFGMLLIGAPVVMAIGTAALTYFFIKPGMTAMMIRCDASERRRF